MKNMVLCLIGLLAIAAFPTHGKMVIDPTLTYDAACKAFQSTDYQQALRLFERAIETGLTGKYENDAYVKMVFSASFLEEAAKTEKYMNICRQRRFRCPEADASEAAEAQASKVALEYLQNIFTSCGGSFFFKQEQAIWELRGVLKAYGCHEPPSQIENELGKRWSCGVEVGAEAERVFLSREGWLDWGDTAPLMVGVTWKKLAAEAVPGQFQQVSCSDIPSRDIQRSRQYGTVNTPGDGFLSLRSEPSTLSGKRLAKIPHGTKLELGECQKDSSGKYGGHWCPVSYLGQEGWVLDMYLSK